MSVETNGFYVFCTSFFPFYILLIILYIRLIDPFFKETSHHFKFLFQI